MRVAIVGSRDYPDLERVKDFVRNLPEGSVVVSGGARGVDSVAVNMASRVGLDWSVHLPDFDKWPYEEYGAKAYFERNKDIMEDADMVVAFWDGESTGTKHAIEVAKGLDIAPKIVYPGGKIVDMMRLDDFA